MAQSEALRIKAQIKHPIVDLDGHWLESGPVFLDFLRETAGPTITDAFSKSSFRDNGWYEATPEERLRKRIGRGTWWSAPTNTLDYATGTLPKLLWSRLPELGIDFSVLYPSMGLFMGGIREEEMRRACVRAYNTMAAELFRPYRDRIAPVAVIPNQTPAEAIDEAKFAIRELGLKAAVMSGNVMRQAEGENGQPGRMYLDTLGLDNLYDYDPVWQTFVDLGIAVTSHGGSAGWPDRMSPSSFVFNHIGHFAQGANTYCKAVFLGGVPRRFPTLNFGFLEGGAGWARSLLSDLIGHWDKRSGESMVKYLRPDNIDLAKLRELTLEYGDERYKAHADEVIDPFGHPGQRITPHQQTVREEGMLDEFHHIGVSSKRDIAELFSRNFYFGCEADDPLTTWAFDKRMGTRLKAGFSSDVSHWDVPDMSEVLPEAFEMVEKELLNAQDFEEFTFRNAVLLHGGMNADFFKGTAIEHQTDEVLGAKTAAV